MRTILLCMFLFFSTIAVGQIGEKYITEGGPASNPKESIFITPKNYYSEFKKFKLGKAPLMGIAGNNDYWKATIPSLREQYFTKEQLALFKEMKYNLKVYFIIDHVGNIICFKLLVSKGIVDEMSEKQLDDFCQALWKLKVPMASYWGEKDFWDGPIWIISSFAKVN